MNYIRLPKVYEKLKKAMEFYLPVIMTAPAGYGKTASAVHFYRKNKPLILTCKSGELSDMPYVDNIRTNVIIIDDLQFLTGEKSIHWLKNLLRGSDRQIVMLTRGTVPKYLAGEDMDLGFIRIQESDFLIGDEEVREFFKSREVEIDPLDVPLVTKASHGYFRALYFYSIRMEGGVRFSEEIEAGVWQDILHYWDGSIYEEVRPEFLHLALSVCRYEEFTKEMAETLTGDPATGKIIEYSHETMGQLRYLPNGRYAFRPEVAAFYRWKQELVWPKEAIVENLRNAAGYYEAHGDLENALKFFKMAGATHRVKEILIRNARKHPGTAHFIETREYYFELPKEEVKQSPVLMAGMSMLCSLMLKPEESEEWYNALVEFEKNKTNRPDRRKEARAWLAHLDIALPHRGTKGILRIMQRVFALIGKGDVTLPEFSVTGNLPSVMNGGLDFCEWSKSDTQIARFMGKPIEIITGKHGNGLVTMCLAESGFEKKTMSPYEVLTRLGDGYEAAAHGGKIEMCFASVGIQVRQHLVEGQLPSARRHYESFREKAVAEKADQLLPNLDAFGVWLSLYDGAGDEAASFVEAMPDPRVFFCTMERYRQMVKLLCLIALERYEEALDASNFLTGYFVSYERHYLWMENEILKSIILFRMRDEHWKKQLAGALKKTAEYHFVRVLSLQGGAILPLLMEIRGSKKIKDIPGDYFAEVMEECQKTASFYPDYLRYFPRETVQLTKREALILSMLCSGMETDKICEELKISYDGLKKHNRNIYRKLGVKGRAEAERKAAQLGLIHRGNGLAGGKEL